MADTADLEIWRNVWATWGGKYTQRWLSSNSTEYTLHNSGGGQRREVCSWQDRPSLPSSDQRHAQFRRCVKDEVAVLGSPFLTVLMVSVDVKHQERRRRSRRKEYWTWTALCLTAQSYRKAEETPIFLSCLPQTGSVLAPGNRKYQTAEDWKPKSWRSTPKQKTHRNA